MALVDDFFNLFFLPENHKTRMQMSWIQQFIQDIEFSLPMWVS
jgi:hypothetical protein